MAGRHCCSNPQIGRSRWLHYGKSLLNRYLCLQIGQNVLGPAVDRYPGLRRNFNTIDLFKISQAQRRMGGDGFRFLEPC